MRRLGMRMASALPRRFNTRRFPIRGRARVRIGPKLANIGLSPKSSSSFPHFCSHLCRPAFSNRVSFCPSFLSLFWGGTRSRARNVNTAEAISPIRCPSTASPTVTGFPFFSRYPTSSHTAIMRITCSAIWENDGICALFIP